MKQPNRESILLVVEILLALILLVYFRDDYQTSIIVSILTSMFLGIHIVTEPEIYKLVTNKTAYWLTITLTIMTLVIVGQQYYIFFGEKEILFIKLYNLTTTFALLLAILSLGIQFGLYTVAHFVHYIIKRKSRISRGWCNIQEPLLRGLLLIRVGRKMGTVRPNYDDDLFVAPRKLPNISEYRVLDAGKQYPADKPQKFFYSVFHKINEMKNELKNSFSS